MLLNKQIQVYKKNSLRFINTGSIKNTIIKQAFYFYLKNLFLNNFFIVKITVLEYLNGFKYWNYIKILYHYILKTKSSFYGTTFNIVIYYFYISFEKKDFYFQLCSNNNFCSFTFNTFRLFHNIHIILKFIKSWANTINFWFNSKISFFVNKIDFLFFIKKSICNFFVNTELYTMLTLNILFNTVLNNNIYSIFLGSCLLSFFLLKLFFQEIDFFIINQKKKINFFDKNWKYFYVFYLNIFLLGTCSGLNITYYLIKLIFNFFKKIHLLKINVFCLKKSKKNKIPFFGFLIFTIPDIFFNYNHVVKSKKKSSNFLLNKKTNFIEKFSKLIFIKEILRYQQKIKTSFFSNNSLVNFKQLSYLVSLSIIRKNIIYLFKNIITTIDNNTFITKKINIFLLPLKLNVVLFNLQEDLFYWEKRFFTSVLNTFNLSWRNIGTKEILYRLNKIKGYLTLSFLDGTVKIIKQKVLCNNKYINNNKVLQLSINSHYIKDTLKYFSIIKFNTLQPISIFYLINQSSFRIIKWFKIKANLYLTWFCCANNYQVMKNIVDYTIRYSLIKTLVLKHNLSQNKIILIYTITPTIFNSFGQVLISYINSVLIQKLKQQYLTSDTKFVKYIKILLFYNK